MHSTYKTALTISPVAWPQTGRCVLFAGSKGAITDHSTAGRPLLDRGPRTQSCVRAIVVHILADFQPGLDNVLELHPTRPLSL